MSRAGILRAPSLTVFLKTLRDNRRALVWWSVGIVAYGFFLVSFYPEIKDQPGFDELLKYSETYQALAGGVESFSTPEGFLNSEAFSIVGPLFLIIYGVGRAASAIAGEEGRGTLPLLLAQPVSRAQVVCGTFAAMVLGLAVLAVAFWAGLYLLSGTFELDVNAGNLAAATASLFLLGTFFGGLAYLLGAATGQRGLAVGITVAVAAAGYLVDALAEIADVLDPYQVLSPFYYYYESNPLGNGLDWSHVVVLAGATTVFFVGSVLAFRRRDVRA